MNPFGLGDVLFSMALSESLKRAFPAARIYFLCNERTDALVAMNTSIDGHFVFNRDYWRSELKSNPFLFLARFFRWLRAIRREKFEIAFDLSLGREYSFILMLLGVRRRVGFDYKGRGVYLTKKKSLPNGYADRSVAETQMELLSLAGIKTPESPHPIPLEVSGHAKDHAAWFLKKHGVGQHTRILTIAPGGGRSWGRDAIYKQWSPERYAQAATALARRHEALILVIGDSDEKDLLYTTAAALKVPHAVIAGESLSNVCALLQRSNLVIANDGGLLHLAHALAVPTVGIYGPVDSIVYGPNPATPKSRVVTAAVPCRPCYRNFRFPACEHNRQCQELISVDEVLRAAAEIM